MAENRDGQVVTFYSFKGGTGRTMAVANTAWILAANGYRVLVVDWDLESPGLHRFFRPFITDSMLASTGGVIDLIRGYETAAKEAARRDPNAPGELRHDSFARVQQHAFSLDWDWPGDGTLDFLSAGRHNRHYSRSISGLNWDDFYEVLAGGRFFDALRADMKQNYDVTLIDSRTGFSDVADICTVDLPDTLVACFTLSDQGIFGAAEVAQSISGKTVPRRIRVLPVAMRIDAAELKKAATGRLVAKQRFAGLPAGHSEEERDAYWASVQVPYLAFYAYEEVLATIEDDRGAPGTLLAAFEKLTEAITNGRVTSLPAMDEGRRNHLRAQYVRMAAVLESEVTLRYDLAGAVWAEWVGWILRASNIRVNDPGPGGAPEGSALAARQMVINTTLDDPSLRQPGGFASFGRPPLVVHVAGAHSPISAAVNLNAARVAGLDQLATADRILRLVGSTVPAEDFLAGAPRFPGREPVVFQVPPRNQRFTGREAQLDRLRERLRADSDDVVPISLHGLGGIGKTQLAMEYAYRFRSSYDVVCWIDADTTADVDDTMHALGQQLGIPMPTSTSEGAQVVKQVLSRGEPYSRWLLIFDNAEDPARIERLLPTGRGHILVTSQDTIWDGRAQLLPVDVFERAESVAHLRDRLPALDETDANRVAELLGDLPIAIAAAAAWLSETGSPVSEYLQAIERGDLGALGSETDISRVEAAWRLSLDRLARQRPAAYRLLELCSVMAPEISLDLVYSDAMAELLVPPDPTRSARLELSRLVQQIKRLALVRVDTQGEHGSQSGDRGDRAEGGRLVIHRLLQLVVRSRMTGEALEDRQHEVHLLLTAAGRLSGEVDEPSQWPRYRILWPHVEVSAAETCVSAPVRQLLVDRVRYFFLRGNPARGLEITQHVEQVWNRMLPDCTTEEDRRELTVQLLQLRFNRANLLRDEGAFEHSLKLDNEIYAHQLELLGPSHPDTLMTAGSLAGDLRGLGRYGEALERDKQTYDAWCEEFYEDHPRTLNALSNLAVSHRLVGNYREALTLDEQVYEARKAVLSENHLSTLQSATSLGRDLREAGEYERSVELLSEVEDAYAEVLGPDSRFVVNARANLAVSMQTAGRPEDAAEVLDVAYERLVALVGPNHPDTLACQLSRSVNLLEMERFAQADAQIKAVRSAYEKRLGSSHPHTLVCVNNLAAASRAQGDLHTARQLARTALEDLRRVLGPDHPYSLAAQMNVAVVAADASDYDEALELMASAADRLATVLGEDHPHTLRCKANQALILRRLNAAEYREQAAAAIAAFGRRVGDEHPAVTALRGGKLLRRIIDPHPF